MTELEQEALQRDIQTRELPYFFTLDRTEQCSALEALIFASEEPLTSRMLHRILVLEDPSQQSPGQQALPLEGESAEPAPQTVAPAFDVPKGFFDELVDEINTNLENAARPYRIVKIAGGFQFATTPQHGMLVQRLLKAKNRRRLTQAALETVAIIAYRQPITKGEVDAIRGVNSSEVVNSLVEKGLVCMVGRSETPGKPLLYGTTEEFLRVFGLNSLSDLPKLREIDDLLKTTTTMIDADDTISIQTDHRTLRKQLALLLEGDLPSSGGKEPAISTEATSGAYWQSAIEETEVGIEDIRENQPDDSDVSQEDPAADAAEPPAEESAE
ncbi:MAG: SMC-Scp complex subunit ScpB [Candidatus Kapabacteria bacterium]|nr:SMC-Scp complex subunit ScpB [Candidatus Kapabacteria bacterium]